MKRSFTTAMVSLFSTLSLLLTGCASSDEMVYQGQYQGQNATVKAHQTSNFNGTRTDWRIQLGDLPQLPVNITLMTANPVPVNGETTTDWGPPYSDSIYGAHQRIYWGQKPAYSSSGDDYRNSPKAQHDTTVLYASENLSQQQFERYAAWMKADWARVDAALASDPDSNFPNLIGLVHGSKALFTRSFRGSCHGVAYVLRTAPDGYVNFGEDDGSAEINHMRHCKVRMPGKIIALHNIYLWKDYRATKADILRFKDDQGEHPDAYFTLQD